MTTRPKLKLEATGQFVAAPLVGVDDNSRPVRSALDHCVAELERVSGN